MKETSISYKLNNTRNTLHVSPGSTDAMVKRLESQGAKITKIKEYEVQVPTRYIR